MYHQGVKGLRRFGLAVVMTLAFGLSMTASAQDARSKILSFDGDTVEGINKKPFDSLSALSEREKRRKKVHLYRKRAGFPAETETLLDEMSLIHD